MPKITVQCIVCHKPFETSRAVICGITCRMRLYRGTLEPKNCARCMRPLPEGQRKYCSPECKNKKVKRTTNCVTCKASLDGTRRTRYCSPNCYPDANFKTQYYRGMAELLRKLAGHPEMPESLRAEIAALFAKWDSPKGKNAGTKNDQS